MSPETDMPLLAPSPSEKVADRCRRYALQIDDYGRDISNHSLLELSEIQRTLEEAARWIDEVRSQQ